MTSIPDENPAGEPDRDQDNAQIPHEDLPTSREQPETQGRDPVVAELGEEGEGDLGPGDI